ncbi:MAG: hypothetical protein ACI88A_000848 [Paraglaciecola sp.]|jgi:hypothetical protein
MNNQLVVETANKTELQKVMFEHFKLKPNARSAIRSSIILGNSVALVEEAFSSSNRQSQCAMSFYQLENGQIKSVVYYPAKKCSTP